MKRTLPARSFPLINNADRSRRSMALGNVENRKAALIPMKRTRGLFISNVDVAA
jgi:hypothetical protein